VKVKPTFRRRLSYAVVGLPARHIVKHSTRQLLQQHCQLVSLTLSKIYPVTNNNKQQK